MPLTKSKGNMYGWCTHTHSHLGGECSHRCSYCYVQAMERRFGSGRYAGPLRLIEKELDINYGVGRTIFIEHCNDLFAADVEMPWIYNILNHCQEYPENTYVFQTKNPARYFGFMGMMPPKRILGCTIETADDAVALNVSDAPAPSKRAYEIRKLRQNGERVFVTVEPILRGPMTLLVSWLSDIRPEFVNIGADSKGTGLDEPSREDIIALLGYLAAFDEIEIREKHNLDRLLRPVANKEK